MDKIYIKFGQNNSMITHDHKIIFVHIPKCAGRSICDLFNQRFDHYTANYYANEYEHFWNRYHAFSIIRNPFDRMVSLYVYIQNHRRHLYERIAVGHSGNLPAFKHWLRANIENFQGSFPMDSAEGLRGTDGDLGSSFWFNSQLRRLSGRHTVRYPIIESPEQSLRIFKLEDGTRPIEKYLADITGLQAAMPHSNKSEYGDYREFYDDALVELASNFPPIKEDCEAFSYKF